MAGSLAHSEVKRDYSPVSARLRSIAPGAGREERMLAVVDALWEAFGHDRPGPGRSVSWVGFYLKVEGKDEMVLGPRRDKPACSPIGLHGACGRAYLSGRGLVVSDVARLGAGYIACDPRDRSEVVVPCVGEDGACWGVLDVDSHDTGAFGVDDCPKLLGVLGMCALTAVPKGSHAAPLVV